ncbi:MAG TPA: hypothetical protein VHC22_34280 [Pirellulales bacterium]|nr:hypothetical protein [Pirellulales bacterium]
MGEKRKIEGVARAVFLALLLLVGYPLSIGPAILIYGATGRNKAFNDIANAVYYPMAFVPGPFSTAIEEWRDLWDVYGVCGKYGVPEE